MEKAKPHPLGFTIVDGKLTGKLKVGMSIEGAAQKDFEMREALTADLLDAEIEAGVGTPLNFNAQLMVRQLVCIGSFKGPFTLNMIRRLPPADFRVLRAAQMELDDLGEAEPASEVAS